MSRRFLLGLWLAVASAEVALVGTVAGGHSQPAAQDTVRGVVRVHEIPEVCQHRPEAPACRDTVDVVDPE